MSMENSGSRLRQHLQCFARHIEQAEFRDPALVVLPPVFSFMEAPESALQTIYAVLKAAFAGAPQLDVHARELRQVDTCAASVLFALLQEVQGEGVTLSLSLPESRSLLRRLYIAGASRVLPRDSGQHFPRTLVRRDAWNPEWSPEEAQRVAGGAAEAIADRLNDWVKEHGYGKLQKIFAKKLGDGLGEFLTNSAIHAQADWWLLSDVEAPQGFPPRVHITAFNFGRSMAETLRTAPPSSVTGQDFEWLRAQHQSGSGFDEEWTDDDLRMIFALQDGATRFDEERGVGTLKGTAWFEYLVQRCGAESNTRMAWVSGNTHVLFDGRYSLRTSPLDRRNNRRDIAFNRENDLRIRPDRSVVTHLRVPFPGTLMTLQFDLSKRFLY